MGEPGDYQGYLAPHVERIRTMHEAGADTRAIAEELYRLGARASTTSPYERMRRDHHVVNLQGMVLHVLQRLGLRTRRRRPQRVVSLTEIGWLRTR
jgi:hypothetical protein